MKKLDVTIQVTRIIAMLMIVLCHVATSYNNIYIKMSGQFLNSGVYIFLFISGYLYGKKEIDDFKKFFTSRFLKLLIPMYIFIIFLYLYQLLCGNLLEIKFIIIYLFNLQGALSKIQGAQHLWFLTTLMFCYLLIPIIQKIRKSNLVTILLFILIFLSIPISYINNYIAHQLFYISTFIIGYICSMNNKYKINTFLATLLLMFFMILRIIMKNIYDDTIFYNLIFTSINHIIIAVLIYQIIKNITFKFNQNKLFNHLDSISYYIYITHYVYIIGPIKILTYKNNTILEFIIFILATFISAEVLKYIYIFIMKKVGEFKNS